MGRGRYCKPRCLFVHSPMLCLIFGGRFKLCLLLLHARLALTPILEHRNENEVSPSLQRKEIYGKRLLQNQNFAIPHPHIPGPPGPLRTSHPPQSAGSGEPALHLLGESLPSVPGLLSTISTTTAAGRRKMGVCRAISKE